MNVLRNSSRFLWSFVKANRFSWCLFYILVFLKIKFGHFVCNFSPRHVMDQTRKWIVLIWDHVPFLNQGLTMTTLVSFNHISQKQTQVNVWMTVLLIHTRPGLNFWVRKVQFFFFFALRKLKMANASSGLFLKQMICLLLSPFWKYWWRFSRQSAVLLFTLQFACRRHPQQKNDAAGTRLVCLPRVSVILESEWIGVCFRVRAASVPGLVF